MDLLVLTIGNRDGGDDAVGPYIADKLKSKKVDFEIVDSGTTPENYTSVVKKLKPHILIIIDAIDMDLKPGDIRRVDKEKIGVMHISTHGIPLSVLINYLQRSIRNIILLGIQPKKMQGSLSKKVREKADMLCDMIIEKRYEEIESL